MLAIQKSGHNFGTTSLCRVAVRSRAPQQQLSPYVQTGCISCCSGDGVDGPVWWNTPLGEEDYVRLGIKKRRAKLDAMEDPAVPEEVKKRLKMMQKSA